MLCAAARCHDLSCRAAPQLIDYISAIASNASIALEVLNAVFGALGRTYIAQVTYCDGGFLYLTESWELDRHDPPEVAREREAEFRHAAALLRTSGACALDGMELIGEKPPRNGEPPANGSKRAE